MSKYDELGTYLSGLGSRKVRLSFADIEHIIGIPLPSSKQYPAWWSNNPSNNVMTKIWLSAGYHTADVDVGEEKVTFVPTDHAGGFTEMPQSSFVTQTAADFPRSPLFGAMKGTTFVAPGVDLTAPTLEAEWLRKYDHYDPSDVIAQHEVSKIVSSMDLNVSQKIRSLNALGVPRAEIAKLLNKRYQHVRNVLVAEEQKARTSA